jgi:hypothetical protein
MTDAQHFAGYGFALGARGVSEVCVSRRRCTGTPARRHADLARSDSAAIVVLRLGYVLLRSIAAAQRRQSLAWLACLPNDQSVESLEQLGRRLHSVVGHALQQPFVLAKIVGRVQVGESGLSRCS